MIGEQLVSFGCAMIVIWAVSGSRLCRIVGGVLLFMGIVAWLASF